MTQTNNTRSRYLILFTLLGLILSGLFIYSQKTFLGINPFQNSFSLIDPSYGRVYDENQYVIDNARKRVVKIDAHQKLSFMIHGGKRGSENFFLAKDLAVDKDGNLYVLHFEYDRAGFYVVKEEILKYDVTGQYIDTIYSKEYGEDMRIATLVQRSHFLSLNVHNGSELTWLELKSDGIHAHKVNEENVHSKRLLYALEAADLLVADAYLDDSGVLTFSTKKGEVLQRKGGELRSVYKTSGFTEEGISTPWSVLSYEDSVFFSDIGDGFVYRVNGEGKTAMMADSYFYKMTISPEGKIAGSTGASIDVFDTDGTSVFSLDKSKYSPLFLISVFLFYISIGLFVFLFIALLRFVFVHLMKRHINDVLATAIGIILIIGVATVLVTTMVINDLNKRYNQEVLNKMAQAVDHMGDLVDGELMKSIENHSDYLDEDYRELRTQLYQALGENKNEWYEGIYFALYKVIDEQLYGFMYLNGEIGALHPFDYYEGEESVYRLAQQGKVSYEYDSDSWGDWMYGIGPLNDSEGNTVGILEVGKNLYTYREQNNQLIRDIILDVATLLVIFILLMIELTYLRDLLRRRKEDKAIDLQQPDIRFARPLAFLYFIPISMAVAFIPILMKSALINDMTFLSEDLMVAMPLTVEMLFFGLIAMFSGPLLKSLGWKNAFFAGLMVIAAGLTMAALSTTTLWFTVARGLAGLGSGIGFLGMRALINTEKNSQLRSEAFAHFYSGIVVGVNIGAVLGALIAESQGYMNVFWWALVLLVPAMFFAWKYIPKGLRAVDSSIKTPFAETLKFFMNYKVLLFIILSVLPTYVVGTFITYYFPLFAEGKGIGTSDIGRLFILNGLFIIYLGPVLSEYLLRRFGAYWSTVMTSVVWGGALLLFVFTQNIPGLIATLALMGVAEGFGVTAQNELFFKMKAVKKIGEDQAVGLFEVFSKITEALGPILFGLALILGAFNGIIIISLGAIIGILLFTALFRPEKSE